MGKAPTFGPPPSPWMARYLPTSSAENAAPSAVKEAVPDALGEMAIAPDADQTGQVYPVAASKRHSKDTSPM